MAFPKPRKAAKRYKMELKEYQKLAKRTCASLGSPKLDIAHMVLGINSEISELEEALINNDKPNISEEISDVFWYVANLYTFVGEELKEVKPACIDKYDLVISLFFATSELQDKAKKHIAYNKEFDYSKVKYIESLLWGISKELNLDVYVGLQNNIDKLKIRYPDKFTDKNATERDLKKERKTLENNI
jgi:NTP pyrophosphatase (non-canonical NTP hydrolase)